MLFPSGLTCRFPVKPRKPPSFRHQTPCTGVSFFRGVTSSTCRQPLDSHFPAQSLEVSGFSERKKKKSLMIIVSREVALKELALLRERERLRRLRE